MDELIKSIVIVDKDGNQQILEDLSEIPNETLQSLIAELKEGKFVKVVQCKDCKFMFRKDGKCGCVVWDGCEVGEEGFCSEGERREE